MPRQSYATKIAIKLRSLEQPVVTSYDLGLIFFSLAKRPNTIGKSEELRPTEVIRLQSFRDAIKALVSTTVLKPSKDIPGEPVYEIFGKTQFTTAEVACSVDPFAYVSHLSAMAHYGLTDRIPRTVFISSPAPKDWNRFAHSRMEKDLGDKLNDYIASGLPILEQKKITRFHGERIEHYKSIHLGAYRNVKGKVLRVSTIGRTFLDMLKEPKLCGGIQHVIDVYKKHAGTYLKLILEEIDTHGGQIDKVRAGFLLSELCHVTNDTINGWRKYAQRGSSRKLDASADYSPHYSEAWSLSINVPSALENAG